MSFDPDALIARRRYRRKLRWWQLATFVSLAAAIIIGLGAAGLLYQGEKIARLRITGVIIEDSSRDALLAQVAKALFPNLKQYSKVMGDLYMDKAKLNTKINKLDKN